MPLPHFEETDLKTQGLLFSQTQIQEKFFRVSRKGGRSASEMTLRDSSPVIE